MESIYEYEPLPPESIRVLELQAGEQNDALVCRLVVQTTRTGPYEAISYVWGNLRRSNIITCNGKRLFITKNLAEVLVRFRYHNADRRLWADAICINQDDAVEREEQLRLMGSIFRSARRMLGWLGADPGTAGVAIEFLLKFNQKPDEYLDKARHLLHHDPNGSDILDPGMDWESWRAIKDFFELPYFHRVWIIQELGLSTHALLFWGKHEVKWVEVAQFCASADFKGASIVNHLQLKCWVAHHSYMIWMKNSIGTPRYNFLEVLHWARVHGSTDARDRIYAFLSHPSAFFGGSSIIQPNYKICAAEAYTELAVEVIERTKNLQILTFVDHDTDLTSEGLPSWVPDWHAVNKVAPLIWPQAVAPNSDVHISVLKFGDKRIVKVRGFMIDTVSRMSNILDPTEFAVTTFTREMQKSNRFLLDSLWEIANNPPNPSLKPAQILEGLSLSLTSGNRDARSALDGLSLTQHQADFAAYILAFEDIRPENHPPGLMAALPHKIKREIEARARDGNATQFVQDMTWPAMVRVVVRTLRRGLVGLGPRVTQLGDVCYYVAGSAYPLVLRPQGGAEGWFLLIGPAVVHGLATWREGQEVEADGGGALTLTEILIV
jgi:hypothetical protein